MERKEEPASMQGLSLCRNEKVRYMQENQSQASSRPKITALVLMVMQMTAAIELVVQLAMTSNAMSTRHLKALVSMQFSKGSRQ